MAVNDFGFLVPGRAPAAGAANAARATALAVVLWNLVLHKFFLTVFLNNRKLQT